MAFAQLGKTADAIKAYREALQLNPDLVGALLNLGWILAADKNEKLRDGPEAVRLASHAVDITQNKDASAFDLLAAAYAENGKFPQATETAEKALSLAESNGPKPLAEQIQARLQLYKEGRSFRAQ